MDMNLVVLFEILLIAGSLLTFAACEVRDYHRSSLAKAKIEGFGNTAS